MEQPDIDHQIQPQPDPGTRLMPSEGVIDTSQEDGLPQNRTRRPRQWLAGLIFGAIVGLLMGALVGVTCCLLGGLSDFVWHGLLLGAVIGPLEHFTFACSG
jgi:hypothetical protein